MVMIIQFNVMKKLSTFFYLFLGLVFVGCAGIEPAPKDFSKSQIFNAKNQEIGFENLINEISEFDIVLIGEYHNKKAIGEAEAKIVRELNSRKKMAVAFEMISSDKQPNLAAAKGKTGSALKSAIDWDDKWKFAAYRPVLETAAANSQILGANLSSAEINQIYEGAYPVNGTISTTNDVKKRIRARIVESHELADDAENAQMLDTLVQIQQYKDRRMADVLVQNAPSILIAGKFHTNKNVGVPLHIKEFKRNLRAVTLAIVDEDEQINAAESDYIWILK